MATQNRHQKHFTFTTIGSILSATYLWIKKHPYPSAIFLNLIYLVIFQYNFLTTGDAWAESYAEYLDESVRLGWSEVFAQNWAGYFSLVPSFVAKVYVYFQLPLGYIDWFYRFTVVTFTVLTVSLIALKMNRSVLRSDLLRILLSLGIIIILFDIASFSFINVWYVAFLPIILLYISPVKISNKADISFGVFGALIALTKPFFIILPLIIYRAIRTRQWIGPSIFLIATLFQTYQIIFNDRRQLVENTSFSITEIINSIFIGSGTSLLKLIGITPLSIWFIFAANIALLMLFILLWRNKSFWIASILGVIYLYAVYTYVLAPDFPVYQGLHSFVTMYSFNYKTQREIIINGILVISLFLLLGSYLDKWKLSKNKIIRVYAPCATLFLSLSLLIVVYKPIDTSSAGVSNAPINSFRMDLNNNLPTCVPLSPTPVFIADTNWVYAHKGTCHTPNHDTNIYKPDFANMNTPAKNIVFNIDALYFHLSETELTAIVVPVENTSQRINSLTIKDQSGATFTSKIEPRDGIQFIAFNTRGLTRQKTYQLMIDQQDDGLQVGYFLNTRTPIVYTYFLEKRS